MATKNHSLTQHHHPTQHHPPQSKPLQPPRHQWQSHNHHIQTQIKLQLDILCFSIGMVMGWVWSGTSQILTRTLLFFISSDSDLNLRVQNFQTLRIWWVRILNGSLINPKNSLWFVKIKTFITQSNCKKKYKKKTQISTAFNPLKNLNPF